MNTQETALLNLHNSFHPKKATSVTIEKTDMGNYDPIIRYYFTYDNGLKVWDYACGDYCNKLYREFLRK